MKLSEFSTDRACDVLCALTPYISNIALDTELADALKQKLKADTYAEMLVVGASKLNKIAPILLRTHRDDVYGIIAVLNDTTVEAVGEQNIIVTMAQIRDIAKDKELIAFFRSCAEPGGSE